MLDVNYFNKAIGNVPYTEFLGLMIDDTLNWDNLIDQLISRLNPACYTVRAVRAVLSKKALRMLYFSCVHSITSCGMIIWSNAANNIKIFRMQKTKF